MSPIRKEGKDPNLRPGRAQFCSGDIFYFHVKLSRDHIIVRERIDSARQCDVTHINYGVDANDIGLEKGINGIIYGEKVSCMSLFFLLEGNFILESASRNVI